MKDKFAIFDMDGTLIDSMSYWYKASCDYLIKEGAELTAEFEQMINEMSFFQVVDYCRNELHMEIDEKDFVGYVEDSMRRYYAEEIPVKPGVTELLGTMKDSGYKMCVVTATKLDLCLPAISHLGLKDYFEFVTDCQGFKDGKRTDAVYMAAARRMGAAAEETVIFEDSPHAIETVSKSPFRLVAVYDKVAAKYENKMRKLADLYVMDLTDKAVNEFLGI